MANVSILGGAPVPESGQAAGAESFLELRIREFRRLNAGGHLYLDHTGSALYPESPVRAHYESCA